VRWLIDRLTIGSRTRRGREESVSCGSLGGSLQRRRRMLTSNERLGSVLSLQSAVPERSIWCRVFVVMPNNPRSDI